jgi:2-polyprenyl-3-methyl-5-hydroxy-6-metoxy-1,4-benzoquinol methylase
MSRTDVALCLPQSRLFSDGMAHVQCYMPGCELRALGAEVNFQLINESIMADLTQRETHFEFGQNWLDYSKTITQEKIDRACETLQQLIPDLAGKSLLDIGSGSGLFSLAALRLGARSVVALDIDENSVAATRALLAKEAPNQAWTSQQASVFDLSPEKTGAFDVVYSWGVLHHTGDMWRAIRTAASLVVPGGQFALAIYRKTPLCPLWRVEKALYARSPQIVQAALRGCYFSAFTAGLLLTGCNPAKYYREYAPRGMTISNDVHDWMGGYPYQSATTEEIERFVVALDFQSLRCFPVKVNLAGALGVGCSEFVFQRNITSEAATRPRTAGSVPGAF